MSIKALKIIFFCNSRHSYWHYAIGMIFHLGALSLPAQNQRPYQKPMENTVANHIYLLEHLKVDLSLSTAGIGIGCGWKPYEVPWLFRANYTYMAGTFNFGLPLGANNGRTTTPVTAQVETQFRMSHFNLLADYLLFYNESLKLTLGVAWHPNKQLSVKTSLNNFKFRDITFTPSEIGMITTSLQSKIKFSPYLGLGFGRSIPKNRIRLSAELGVYYLGDWRVNTVKIQEGIILNRWTDKNSLILENLINAHTAHKLLPNLNLMINYLIY